MGNKTTHHHHHDDSGARNHAYRMQQLSNQRASQQAQETAARRSHELRTQQQKDQRAAAAAAASRQHSYRMQQLEKQKQLEMQKEQERQRAAQRAFEERKKQMKLQEKTAAIARVKSDIVRFQTRSDQIQSELTKKLNPQLVQIEKELKLSEQDIETFTGNCERVLGEMDEEIKKQREKYKAADDKIRDVIQTADVDESNIPQFLNLVNDGLLFATMRGQHERDKMTAKLKVFSELIERTCNAKLAINTYFKDQGLQRFTPILAEEGYTKMFELKCPDQEDWDEMKVMLVEGLKNTDPDKKKQKMKSRERKMLEDVCRKPDKTWLPDQNDQEAIVRKSLMTSAGRLSKFFGILHNVTGEVDELLRLSPQLTEEQQKAIAYASKEEEEEKKETTEDVNERQLWDKDSQCLVLLEGSGDTWCCGRITDIMYDERGEWLQIEYSDRNNQIQTVQKQRFAKCLQPMNASARKAWTKGSECEIYSESSSKWVSGCIANTKNDDVGEWLQVEYDGRSKEIGRYSPQIRCCSMDDDAYSQSKDVATMQFQQKDMNQTNKQCNALNSVVIQKLHITESLVSDFVVDEKEMEAMESQINAELVPKQQELKAKKEQLEDVRVDMELIKDEIAMMEDDSDSGSDSDSDDDGLNLKELKKKKKKTRLKEKKLELSVAKIEKQIDVIERQKGGIVSIGNVLKEAFTVASNIEDSCLQIMKSQCVTRQSILLARELLKYKPAQPHAKAKPLWDTITTGIGDIFDNALQLNKIAATYFGFFVKFQYSFDHFVTCNKMNKNVSMLVALEHLNKDVTDIQAFQAKMDGKVDQLRDAAIKTIRDCVSNTAGAQEFETAISQRQVAESALREANAKYNAEKFKLDDEFQEKFGNQQRCIANKRSIEYQMKELNKNAAMNQQWIQQLGNQVKSLESLMVT
eukprot:500720_1